MNLALGAAPDAGGNLHRRGVLVVLFLLVEAVVLTSMFDLPPAGSEPTLATELLRFTPFLLPACAAIGTATLLFGGARLRRTLEGAGAERTPERWWPAALAHALLFAAFCAGTAFVLDPERGAGLGWIALWALTGALAVAALGAAALPPAVLGRACLRGSGVLATGTVVGLLAWWAGRESDAELWRVLGDTTLLAVHAVVQLASDEAAIDVARRVVGTRAFQVEVGSGCSGWEGIGLVSVFLTAYLWFFRATLRFPGALLLLPIGIGLIWCANVLRIAVLIAVGARISPEVAVTAFHARAGWLFFCAVSWGLVVLARRLRFFARDEVVGPAGPYTALPWLGPLLILLLGGLVTQAFTTGVDLLEPLTLALAAGALWLARDRIELRRSGSLEAVGAGVAVYGLWVLLAREPEVAAAGSAPDTRTALAGLPVVIAFAWLVARAVGTIVVVPLVEEIAFRGYLLRRLQTRSFERIPLGRLTLVSLLGSSLLFGLLHQAVLAGAVAGVVYALVLARRRELGDAVLAHAVTNGLLVLHAVALQEPRALDLKDDAT